MEWGKFSCGSGSGDISAMKGRYEKDCNVGSEQLPAGSGQHKSWVCCALVFTLDFSPSIYLRGKVVSFDCVAILFDDTSLDCKKYIEKSSHSLGLTATSLAHLDIIESLCYQIFKYFQKNAKVI